jgi:hypothetical protein
MFSSSLDNGEINDVSVHVVEALIKWMYLPEIEDKTVIEDLYELSNRYMIKDLQVTNVSH